MTGAIWIDTRWELDLEAEASVKQVEETSSMQTPTLRQSQQPLHVLHLHACDLAATAMLRASLDPLLGRNKLELPLWTQGRFCQVKYLSFDLLHRKR